MTGFLFPAVIVLGILRMWVAPSRLRRAERLWSMGRPAQEVLQELDDVSLIHGELGYRMHQLRGFAWMSLKQRDRAQMAFREAALVRLPFWARWPVRAFFRFASGRPGPRTLRWGELLLRLTPGMGRLRHLLGLHFHLAGQQQRAWELLVETVPLAADDPLLLEDLMTLGLARIQAMDKPLPRLGVQELHPELPYVFEETLDLLQQRHGDPRLGWDRTLPARHLALKGRHREVVNLLMGVPPSLRSMSHWEVLASALKQLGDTRGLHQILEDALEYQPTSFRLWMERFQSLMEQQRLQDGFEALEHARRLLPADSESGTESLRWEWLAQRAGYAHWISKDPDRAWEFLEAIPERGRTGRIPLLRVQVLSSLGRYEEAQEALRPLFAVHPQDLDLQILQAQILAGLEAWKALLLFLEQGSETLRGRADFWHLQGLALAHLEDFIKARESLERAAFMARNNLRFILDAGHGSMDLSDFARAEHHWRQALKLDERCEEALVQLAETRRALHDEEGAKRLLRECLLHHPDSEEAQVSLAEMEAH